MTRKDTIVMLNYLHTECARLLKVKGAEYTADNDDALANFKFMGSMLDASPLLVCMFGMFKHFMSLISYTKRGHVVSDEGIDRRCIDLINYVVLFLCLVSEDDEAIAAKAQAHADFVHNTVEEAIFCPNTNVTEGYQ